MQGVSVVMCDFSCQPRKKVDCRSLRKELAKAGIQVVVAKKPCRQGIENLDDLQGEKVLFAGCPLLEENGLYGRFRERFSAAPANFLDLDVKRSILDLYDDAKSIEQALSRSIKAHARILEAKEAEATETVKPEAKVLVYGAGYSGLHAAAALCATDVSVDVLETSGPTVSPGCLAEALRNRDAVRKLRAAVEQSQNGVFIPHRNGVRLSALENGFHMRTGDGMEALYGAVVFAPERVEGPCAEEGALNLSALYAALERRQQLRGITAFLLDRGRPSTPEVVRDVLEAAKIIRDAHRGEVWVLLRNVQVSLQYQEELYGDCRDAGVVFVKYREDLSLVDDYGSFDIAGHDEQVHTAFSIHPDRLVIPQIPRLPAEAGVFAAALKLRLEKDEYSQSDSLWNLPNDTNRTGVFAVGSARSGMIPTLIRQDVSSLVAAVEERLDPAGFAVEENIPVVDADKCVYCLTCVRVCPFGAMAKDPEQGAARVIASACRACGICVAECPAEALEVRNLRREALFSAVEALAEAPDTRPPAAGSPAAGPPAAAPTSGGDS